jgi:YVTN family beta-propeller protein
MLQRKLLPVTRRGRRAVKMGTTTAALVVLGAGAALAAGPAEVAGPRANGTAVTSNGYQVTPAGEQQILGDLPLVSALSPDGKRLVVVNAGQGTQSVQVVDTGTGQVVQTIPYTSPAAVYGGVAFSPDGTRLFVAGGGSNVVHTYDVAPGGLSETAPLSLPIPPGTDATGEPLNPFAAGLAVTPDGARLVVAEQLTDSVGILDLATGAVSSAPVGHRPYGVTLSADGRKAYVSDQGGQSLSVVDVTGLGPVVRADVPVGTHPSRSVLSPDGLLLYVANGDSDTISVVQTATDTVSRMISLAPYPEAEVGSNPDGLATSPDGKTLYVANSGNNDVAVIDLARDAVTGMIPVGWYPTSVAITGGRLWVTNGRGLGAGPNNGPGHPDPYRSEPAAENQYSGSMIRGTLSIVATPSPTQLARLSKQVVANNAFDERGRVRTPAGTGSVIPRRVGQPSPIKHVIYVVKENRTFDQVLGDLGRGNGDPSLTLFGRDSAPNTHALAEQFTTFDNFYADAEVSANGWNWVTAANSNNFAEQQWPANYSSRGGLYPSENGDPAIGPNAQPMDSHLWNQLADSHVSFANYGFYVNLSSPSPLPADSADPVLDKATNHQFTGFTLECPDSSGTFTPLDPGCGPGRIDTWLQDFWAEQASGTMPAVQFVRLPSDHTAATKAGYPTPKAYVADNDYALGRLVDAVSHSQFWKDTAIFVTEDDAQDGPDHVDAHRTLALVISPYTQTGRVDSTFYDSASMLRTIELMAGVGPLTQFDAYASPMAPAFTGTPDLAPYTLLTPSQPFDEVNAAGAPMATASAMQDFTREDRADETTVNEAIWKSVHGDGSVMPAPEHNVLAAGTAGDTDG